MHMEFTNETSEIRRKEDSKKPESDRERNRLEKWQVGRRRFP